jgi:hypothetical protein
VNRRHLLSAGICFALPLFVAGCGGGDDIPPAEAYIPPNYSILPKIRLNVGSIVIQDNAQPLGPQDIAATSPVVPAQALEQMARDRLFAAGFAGTATFVIDQASIIQSPNGTLTGTLAVHLQIQVPGGAPGGFAAAQVQRQHVPGSDPENPQNNLYDLTKQMLDAMNVEFEFQVRKSLSNWIVTGDAAPAPVQAQPLAPEPPPVPAAAQTQPGSPPAPPAPPAGTLYRDPLAPLAPPPPPPPPQLSPPPTYLQAPPGAAPSNGY